MQYETLDRVVELVKPYGHADIQDAFRLIPIRPQDYPLLGIIWKSQFYHVRVLPIGSSVSCQTFKSFSCAVQWMLQHKCGVVGVTNLLDDFISVGPARETDCMNSLLSFELLSQH